MILYSVANVSKAVMGSLPNLGPFKTGSLTFAIGFFGVKQAVSYNKFDEKASCLEMKHSGTQVSNL